MTYQQVYKAQHARIVRENVLKAAIYSLLAGFSVAAVIAFATIFVEFNGLWTAIGAGLGVAVVLTPILYFAIFRPTEKSVAESLDRLGFDERAITMLELEGDTSVMANIQRDDAVNTFTAAAEKNGGKLASAKALPFSQKLAVVGLNTKMLIATGVVVVVAATTLTFTAMPRQQVKEIFLGTNTYGVTYNAGEHGYIVTESSGYKRDAELARVGKYSLTVDEGKMSERIAVSAYGNPLSDDDQYMFAGWSDDYYDQFNAASRSDKVLMGITATAKYEKLDVVEDDPADNGGGSGGSGSPGDGNPDAPKKPGDSNDTGNGDSSNDMDDPGNGAGMSDTPMNSEVIDGQTDYQEGYNESYDDAMSRLSDGEGIPDSLRNLISGYFESLR